MQKKKATDLREIVFLDVISDSDFVPTLDLKIAFKDPDGALKKIGMSVRISRELNPPKLCLFVGGYNDIVLGNENKSVDGISFAIKNPLVLSTLLSNLGAHFSTLAAHKMLAPTQDSTEESPTALLSA